MDAEEAVDVQVSFRRLPKSVHHGFDGNDAVAGVCSISGCLVSPDKLAKANQVEVRLATKLMHLCDPASGSRLILAGSAVRRNTDPFLWLLSHLPSPILRWVILLPTARRLLTECPRMLPVLPVPFSNQPRAVVLQEHIRVLLPVQAGAAPEVMGEGSIGINLDIDLEKLKEMRQRFRRLFGSRSDERIRAGFLIIHDRPQVNWPATSESFTPRSRSVVEIANLKALIPHTTAGSKGQQPLLTSQTLSLSLPFSLDRSFDGASLASILSIAISPEHDQDRDAVLVYLTYVGDRKNEELATIEIRTVTIGLPVVFPPIEETSVQQFRPDGYWDKVTEHSSIFTEDRHTWTTRFPYPVDLLPGKAMIFRLRCRHEESSIWNRGGNAIVTAVYSYTKPLTNISRCEMVDAVGRIYQRQNFIYNEERNVTVVATLDLDGHAFLRTHTVTRRLDNLPNFHPNRTFTQTFTDRLADARVLVRRILEAQSTSYEGRATPFECSMYGRVERSMASPDLHIRIQSERQPPVEVTVSGKVRGEDERTILEEMADEVAGLAREIAADETPAVARRIFPDASVEDVRSDQSRLAVIEGKLDRLITLLELHIERGGLRQ